MKEMQCSETESTANHPAFSAPGLTRHRAACCVVALVNARALSLSYTYVHTYIYQHRQTDRQTAQIVI